MSADNWDVCPRCVKRAEDKVTAALAASDADYGKLPVAEWTKARAAIGRPADDAFRTFREDYEIYGAEAGVITVSYGGGCEVCGLSLSFKEDHPIPDLDGTS